MAGEGVSEVTGAREIGSGGRCEECGLSSQRKGSQATGGWQAVIGSDFHFRRIPPSARLRINCRRQDRNQGDQLETISRIQWEVATMWTRLVAVEG